MQTLHAPELRLEGARNLVRTASGILIGGAYVRSPERQSEDADFLQRALLASRPVPIAKRFARLFRKPTLENSRWIKLFSIGQ